MIRIRDDGTVVEREEYRAILAGVTLGEDIDYSMKELEGLAEADGIEVLGTMTQKVEKINAATFIGSGKLKELAEFVRNMEADLVVFNDELSGMQLRNIEEAAGCRIIDRTILILDIFADRATSMEGKLQVELAQLQYRMPRLLGFGKSLSRLGGGIGTRGPGESKLESDRRHLKERIRLLEDQLDALSKNREVQRRQRARSGVFRFSIAGYTNAGKSTLLNALTGAGVKEKDELFATLDPTTRKYELPSGTEILLTDTVGFIRNLPHHLVKAFRSTLDEVTTSDAVLLVLDVSDPEADAQLRVTMDLLSELGARNKPILCVLNKCDLAETFFMPFNLGGEGLETISISAKTGQGIDRLVEKLEEISGRGKRRVTLVFPHDKLGLISRLYDDCANVEVEYTPEGAIVTADLDKASLGRYAAFIKE